MEQNINYVTYIVATGQIRNKGNCLPDVFERKIQPTRDDEYKKHGTALLQVSSVDHKVQYVDTVTDTIIDRPVMGSSIDKTTITANASDTATVSDIPVGTRLQLWRFNSLLFDTVVDDGEFGLTVMETGTYTIKLTNFPDQDEEYSVDGI